MAATAQAMDFTNVKEAGNFNPKRVPEGSYKAKIVKVDDHTSKGSKVVDNWVFTIQLTAAGRSRGTYPYYCGFDEKFAWKIRNLLIAAGMAVPKKKVKVDPNKLVGKFIGVEMENDDFEGKLKSAITATFPVDELDGDAPTGGSGSDDDTDEDTDVTDGEDEELDLEEL
jgi:hypothetical protein